MEGSDGNRVCDVRVRRWMRQCDVGVLEAVESLSALPPQPQNTTYDSIRHIPPVTHHQRSSRQQQRRQRGAVRAAAGGDGETQWARVSVLVRLRLKRVGKAGV